MALTIFSGGLFSAVVAGATLGFAAGVTTNIVSQVSSVGWANVDLGQAWIDGGIGAAVGAISGGIAYGFGFIAQSFGQKAGYVLREMTHIGSGIRLDKVFNPLLLMGIGGTVGKIGGTIAGAVVGEFIGNKLFNKDYNLNNDFRETIRGQILDWIVSFFKWVFK